MIYSLADGMKPLSSEGKNDLEIGRVLQLNGYSNPKYAIIRKLGISNFGCGMLYRTINLETKEQSGAEAITLKFLSEKKDGRIQMYITDEVLEPEAVLDLFEAGEVQKKLKEIAVKEKADFKAKEREELKVKYKDLQLIEGSGKSSAATGAKNIKSELQKAFPGVKFSVKSDYYSGGCSIDVNYTDGPTVDKVRKITNKYEEGSFDGMTDCYNYDSENQFPDLFGGAKYVMEQRSVSIARLEAVAEELGYKRLKFNTELGNFDGVDLEVSRMIKREADKMSFK